MDIKCVECGEEYDVDEHPEKCPSCGFGPERCSHPLDYRESEMIYSVDEGKEVERVYCDKCGTPITEI